MTRFHMLILNRQICIRTRSNHNPNVINCMSLLSLTFKKMTAKHKSYVLKMCLLLWYNHPVCNGSLFEFPIILDKAAELRKVICLWSIS